MNIQLSDPGRISREEYITSITYLLAVTLILAILLTVTLNFVSESANGPDVIVFIFGVMTFYNTSFVELSVALLLWSWFIIYITITWSLSIRRLHDLGKSGWYAVIFLVPNISFLFGLYLVLANGEDVVNEYGERPLENLRNSG